MAAAALEQSMLESKDKDTLLEMAKALGVKANARLKKSDIIDKILDTTGSSTASGTDASRPDGDPADAGSSNGADTTSTDSASLIHSAWVRNSETSAHTSSGAAPQTPHRS